MITTAAALLLASSVWGQKIVVRTDIVDCGDVLYRHPVTASFSLKNDGTKKLKIRSVKPDCGCVVVKHPKDVAAGNDFTITATYDAETMGTFDKAMVVTTNASDEPVVLRMRGRVAREVKDYSQTYPVQMGSLRVDRHEVVFDNVNRGDMPTEEIGIINTSGKTYTPTLMHMPNYLKMQASPSQLRPGESGQIRLTLNSNNLRDMGLSQSTVYLSRFPGDKVSEETAISVSAILLPDLTQWKSLGDAAPSIGMSDGQDWIVMSENPAINFGPFGKKKKLTKIITVGNNGSSNLEISSLQVFTPGMDITLSKRIIAPGETATLKITLHKTVEKLKVTPRLLVITNDPKHPKMTIRAQWE